MDFVCNKGLVVNYDNEPSPKNVSQEQVYLMDKVGVLMELIVVLHLSLLICHQSPHFQHGLSQKKNL